MPSPNVRFNRFVASSLIATLGSVAAFIACGESQPTAILGAGGQTGATTSGGASSVTGQGGATSSGQGGSSTTGQGGATTSTSSATGGATTVAGCGKKNDNPFNCKFAWGAPSNNGNESYMNFVSTWIGDETNGGLGSWSATATNSGAANQNACGDCNLVKTVAGTNSMVVFYTYFIGFQACKQGKFCDCNTSSPPNLCSNGAQWLRDNRATIVNAYGQYAKAVYANSPNKPTIWWLEGDFVQYSYAEQTNALSYADLGDIAREITCAIKSNQPNAIVGMNHSPWLANDVTIGFWAKQPKDVLDLVWVQGLGNSDTFSNSGSYNATSANYTFIHTITGLKIMAETSNGQENTWLNATAADINARIASGVIGVHLNAANNVQSTIAGFPAVNSTCN